MQEAVLYEKLDNRRVRCRVCPRLCSIASGKLGVCGVRLNRDGVLLVLNYGLCSSVAVDPIEKKPLFHFHPGSLCLSLGTVGCNLRCVHCQNWQIAHADAREDGAGLRFIDPAGQVRMAREHGCQGVAWTYNEPTIWLEYTVDSAKACREAGLYTAYVTNGYITFEALDLIGPHLDAYRVDVKGFTKEFYRKLAKVPDFKPILEAAMRAKKTWGCHVEVVTNVIPTWNDDDAQLRGIAEWIASELGPETPWHVTRFMPYLELSDLPATPVDTLERARRIGLDAGLKFVYLGNVPGHQAEDTSCPVCGLLDVERSGYSVGRYRVTPEGACEACGADLNIVGAGPTRSQR